MTFGERLRELREERDLTQKTFAGLLGVSPRMVSFYESGAHFPQDERILLRGVHRLSAGLFRCACRGTAPQAEPVV